MGDNTNMSEFEEAQPMSPGDWFLIPLGIAHSVKDCKPDFRRMVIYSRYPFRVLADPLEHVYESRFEVRENVIEPAPWHAEARELGGRRTRVSARRAAPRGPPSSRVADVLSLPAAAAAPYVIDVILNASGANAYAGQTETAALKVFEQWANRHGGVSGRPIHFEIYDDQTEPPVAVQLANQILAAKPIVMLGSGQVADVCSDRAAV